MHWAHSLEGRPPIEWEPLEQHLRDVANLAGEFAERIGARHWGELLGHWHDLGKYSAEFQSYLHRANGIEAHLETVAGPGKVDHPTAGAQHAVLRFRPPQDAWIGRCLAYCIAGHHAGLPDAEDVTGRSGLNQRLKKDIPDYSNAPEALLHSDPLPLPPMQPARSQKARDSVFQLAFFTRMLFSCLVDADFLATERFLDPRRSSARNVPLPSLSDMAVALEAHLDRLTAKAAASDPGTVNQHRAEVLEACRAAAEREPGLFSLTVPTGGGKTLASLDFALRHARQHGLDRVIYAIPFTSIIEQTADVFRGVFDRLSEHAVLEHHSNLDPDSRHETPVTRLAAENWNAPLVVTTNVQFFESLFASRTSRCRKLHRIARSVIILDEAQTLPVELLHPCLNALRELALNYGCTIAFCTATQPALTRNDDFRIGIEQETIREIIPQPERLYRSMKRVDVTHLGPLTDDELATRLDDHKSFLCIVNTRPHAAELFEKLRQTGSRAEGLFHLSTRMCGAHRSEVVTEIRNRLKSRQPYRVISTQLIEAGVDVDFPVVFRALTGVDSIAQAAGRCNREGRLSGRGQVFVFEPQGRKLRGLLQSVADTTAELLPDTDDLLAPETIERYFRLHYWKQRRESNWDHRRVLEQFKTDAPAVFQFRTASELFRMIEDVAQPVLVPYGNSGKQLIERLADFEPPDHVTRRRLQRFTVPVYENVFRALLAQQQIEIRHDSYAVLLNEDMYDEQQMGLRTDRSGINEPESLIL